MSNNRFLKFLSPVIIFLISFSVASSQAPVMSPLQDNSIQIYQLYMGHVGGSALLFNGPEYTGSYPETQGTQFFDSPDFRSSEIEFDGVLYRNVLLAYDLVLDQVVIKGFQNLSMVLQSGKINYFTLSGHVFKNIISSTDSLLSDPSIYEVVFYGRKTQLFIKRKKQVIHSTSAEEPFRFQSYDRYYIQMENKFYPVSNKKEFLLIVKDHVKEVKAFIKESRLNFKKDWETTVYRSLAYYDQLKSL